MSTRAAQEELQRRLECRDGTRDEPSEADVAVLHYQREHADALDEDERACVIEVATDEPVDVDKLVADELALQ